VALTLYSQVDIGLTVPQSGTQQQVRPVLHSYTRADSRYVHVLEQTPPNGPPQGVHWTPCQTLELGSWGRDVGRPSFLGVGRRTSLGYCWLWRHQPCVQLRVSYSMQAAALCKACTSISQRLSVEVGRGVVLRSYIPIVCLNNR
jgi:hypothetical protein